MGVQIYSQKLFLHRMTFYQKNIQHVKLPFRERSHIPYWFALGPVWWDMLVSWSNPQSLQLEIGEVIVLAKNSGSSSAAVPKPGVWRCFQDLHRARGYWRPPGGGGAVIPGLQVVKCWAALKRPWRKATSWYNPTREKKSWEFFLGFSFLK